MLPMLLYVLMIRDMVHLAFNFFIIDGGREMEGICPTASIRIFVAILLCVVHKSWLLFNRVSDDDEFRMSASL